MKFNGFTLVELMVAVAITGILVMLAAPALGDFITKLRVDSQINELHRMALVARNHAVSSGQNVTLCPLGADNSCENEWQNELSLFTDTNNNNVYENNLGEQIIQVRSAINPGDELTFTSVSLRYRPDGRLSPNGTFRYCPKNHSEYSRAIIAFQSGRLYLSSDIDNDGKDEDSAGNDVICN